jgi:cysteate synthase
MENHYTLTCVHCGKSFDETDDGFLLDCGEKHPPSLLRSVYRQTNFTVRPDHCGIFRYSDWLPIRRTLECPGMPVVFQSRALARETGLEKLFISFSGYWPARGAGFHTCSFKELEALSVCARIKAGTERVMVVASAGNTGRSFLQLGSINRIPLLVVIPEFALSQMLITVKKPSCVKLAVLRGDGDYFSAIELAGSISALQGYYGEGGARNVARRDGMGTVVLAAIEAIGEIPAHYFQAVGSGTGGIAAWEMSKRLHADGRFDSRGMKLHFIQNEPFDLMTRAWRAGTRELPILSAGEAWEKTLRLHARVLSNRKPPYGIAGGVFDALADTSGHMYTVGNEEAQAAGLIFKKLEGCDLDPAAEVALAGLMQAARAGTVGKDEIILLNLTGGGAKLLAAEGNARQVEPDFEFSPDDAKDPSAIEAILHGGRAGGAAARKTGLAASLPRGG